MGSIVRLGRGLRIVPAAAPSHDTGAKLKRSDAAVMGIGAIVATMRRQFAKVLSGGALRPPNCGTAKHENA